MGARGRGATTRGGSVAAGDQVVQMFTDQREAYPRTEPLRPREAAAALLRASQAMSGEDASLLRTRNGFMPVALANTVAGLDTPYVRVAIGRDGAYGDPYLRFTGTDAIESARTVFATARVGRLPRVVRREDDSVTLYYSEP